MRAADYIADEYRRKIALLLQEYGQNDFGQVTWKDTLKYSILHDASIKVEVVSSTCFDVYCEIGGDKIIDTPNITSARIADYVSNARRIKQQYKTASIMSENKEMAAPWVLVSTYYSSFFAANELLRLYDQIPLGLDSSEYSQLKEKAFSNNAEALVLFNSRGARNYVGKVGDNSIRYTSVGEKPHQAAWNKVSTTLSRIMREKGWPELLNYINFAKGDGGWVQPSDLRNSWNYKRADLYSPKGQQMCKKMFECLGRFDVATEWFLRATPYDDTAHCTALSATTEFLVSPIIRSYDSLFETKLLI